MVLSSACSNIMSPREWEGYVDMVYKGVQWRFVIIQYVVLGVCPSEMATGSSSLPRNGNV